VQSALVSSDLDRDRHRNLVGSGLTPSGGNDKKERNNGRNYDFPAASSKEQQQ